jgi:hypothetical protein
MVIRGGTALTTCKTPGCSSSGNARVIRAFDLNQVRVLRELSYGLAARGVFVSHLPLGRARAGPARTGLPAGPGSRRPLYKSALGALPWRAFCSSAGHYCSTWVVLQVHESQTGRLPCRLSSGRQPGRDSDGRRRDAVKAARATVWGWLRSVFPTMRVAVGGIVHETNTYATALWGPSTLENFTQNTGESLLAAHTGGVRSCLGGMLAAAEELGIEIVPTFHAEAQPSGTVSDDAFRTMQAQLLDGLKQALASGTISAVALDLHGAGVFGEESHSDLECEVGRSVRELIGPDMPLVTTLDLHGNLSAEMAGYFDVMLGFHLFPHEVPYAALTSCLGQWIGCAPSNSLSDC